MRGGYGNGDQGDLASRTGADRPADPPTPARHCFVKGRVISVVWIDAVGWASMERWLPADFIDAS